MVDREQELSALLSSASLVLIGGIIASTAKLGERIVIGRLLSPSAYGEVSVGLAIFTFSTTIAIAGLHQGISRFLPRYDNSEHHRGVWVSGLILAGGFSLFIAAILVLSSGWIVDQLFETNDAIIYLRILAISLPFYVGFRISVAAIRGFENTIYRTIVYDLLDPLLRVGLIAILLLAGVGIAAAGIGYLVAAIFTCVAAALLLSKLMPLLGSYRTFYQDLLIFSIPLVVSTVINRMLTTTDTVMIGYFRSSYEVGMYDAAYPLANGLTIILVAFGFLYLPIASRLDSEGESHAIDSIYATTTKWVYVLTFPAFLLFVIFPQNVIQIFFGQSYSDAASVLPILSLGFFLSAAVGRDRETLSAVGATTWIAIGNAAGLLVNIFLNIMLIPRYSFVGAGVASVTSIAVVHLIITAILAIRYNITPISSYSIRTFISLPAVLFPVTFLLSPWISISVLTLFPFLVVSGILSLIVVGLVNGFEPDDIVIIDLVEDTIGFSVPLIRRWIPTSEPPS